jgi:hypothetical protein
VLESFGPSLYVASGPVVSFYGFPYPTRMAAARLSDGSVWIWSPIPLGRDLVRDIEALGPVRHIVSPNKIHHLFLAEAAARWPGARCYAPPGLAARRPALRVDALLDDDADPSWGGDLASCVVRGSFVMEEVEFFHRPSRTAIIGDLVQRHDPARIKAQAIAMRLDGLIGERGSTPRMARSFLRQGAARAARARILAWQPSGCSSYGACAESGAFTRFSRAPSRGVAPPVRQARARPLGERRRHCTPASTPSRSPAHGIEVLSTPRGQESARRGRETPSAAAALELASPPVPRRL